ncbi:MAG: DEAD/DEAH box helicase [bacterium]
MTTERKFRDFELDPKLIEAVTALGFETPTPIQNQAIPVLLSGRDVIGRARTGSGKTAAFGLPLINKVAKSQKKNAGVRGLVLAPTRELAIQVANALQDYAKGLRIEICPVYGGAAYGPQLAALRRGVDIVVGTPGRVIDHIDRGTLKLNNIEMFVLDEADEMLRMGFIEDVERVLQETPDTQQFALFSATMPSAIQRVAKKYLKDPVEVQVEGQSLSTSHVTQKWMNVPDRKKPDALYRVLVTEKRGGTLVFARTRRSCAEVCDLLNGRGVKADALHGDLNQQLRERVLQRLRDDQIDVVVATDVAARGLDVDTLTHVINLDLPGDSETYVHRIGRTARAGREGVAISFVTPSERRKLRFIERDTKQRIEEAQVPTDGDVARMQLEGFKKDLAVAIEHRNIEDVRTWVNEWIAEGIWNYEDIALAAVGLYVHERGIEFQSARKVEQRSEPRERKPREERFDDDEREFNPDEINGMFLYVAAGKRHGVRPGDIVGALANDTGISGKSIGKVMVGDTGTVVGLPTEIANMILSDYKHVAIRGRSARISLARPEQLGAKAERALRVKGRGKARK